MSQKLTPRKKCQLGWMESPWPLHDSIRMSSKVQVHAFRCPTCWIWTKLCESVWRVCESVWRSAWGCLKVSQMGFPVWKHAFRHPICWIWPKISQNRAKCENCAKSVWEFLKECIRVCECIKNEFPWSSTCYILPKIDKNRPEYLNSVWE